MLWKIALLLPFRQTLPEHNKWHKIIISSDHIKRKFAFLFHFRALGDKSVKAPSYTRDYRFFKYKPDCSGITEDRNKSVMETKKLKEKKKENKANENMEQVKNNNVIEAEIVCHVNRKCHPNA